MQLQKDAYLNQTLQGDSRWWVWGIVFWFTVLGWIASQLIVAYPVGPILAVVDPELSNQVADASLSVFNDENMLKLILYILSLIHI